MVASKGQGPVLATPGSRRKGLYRERTTTDLPGLAPQHDGSYGINTLINLDSVKKRGRMPKASVVAEDKEDKRFEQHVNGRSGKKYDMQANLPKALEKAKKEAEKEPVEDETETGGDKNAHQPLQGPAGGEPLKGPTGSGPMRGPTASEPPWRGPTGGAPLEKPMGPYIPRFNGPGYFTDESDIRQPPYTPAGFTSPNPHELGGNHHRPSAPPTEHISYYGMPTGRGSSVPISPFRPDSSRSYNYESGLYGDATLRNPGTFHIPAPNLWNAPGHETPAAVNTNTPALGNVHIPSTVGSQSPSPEPATTPRRWQPPKFSSSIAEAGPSNNPINNITNNGNSSANTRSSSSSNPIITTTTTATTTSGSSSSTTRNPRNNGSVINSTSSKEPNNNNLTADELQMITRLVQDMRLPPNTSNMPDVPDDLQLDDLTLSEIQAVRALISDMGTDQAKTYKIVLALDAAMRRLEQGAKPSILPQRRPKNTANSNSSGAGLSGPSAPGGGLSGNRPAGPPAGGPLARGPPGGGPPGGVPPGGVPPGGGPPGAPSGGGFLNGLVGRNPWNALMTRLRSLRGWINRLSWCTLLDRIFAITRLALMFLFVLAGVWVLLLFLQGLAKPLSNDYPSINIHWPDWHIIKDSVAELIPPRENIPIPTFTSGGSTGIWDRLQEASSVPKKWGKKEKPGKNGDKLGKVEIVEDLKKKIPDKIHVERDKSGKLKISQDFWHALRENIRANKIVLTLQNAKNGSPKISDDHWDTIKSRIEEQLGSLVERKGGKGKSGPSTEDVELVVEDKLSRSWENWLNQNEDALKKMATGVSLTKEEFLVLFREEVESYQREIRKELTGLDTRIEQLKRDLSKLGDGSPSSSGGMNKKEVKAIVDAAVQKAVANAKLDAVANGRIRGHASDMLFNQVNFFGMGSGATVDPQSSSRPWTIPKDFFKSKRWYDRDGYKAQPRSSALSPWRQEGECFCAAPDLKGYGYGTNNISVLMSRDIVPQHLVVEHILPGSTLDPGAIPRDIEVWAYIEEMTLRNEVKYFSATQFPGTAKETTLNEGFQKIGHFVYQYKDHGDGIQVFKMKDELAQMKAVTNHIVVRATSNYGADHTCFYRLRMYGEVEDRPADSPTNDPWVSKKWF